MGKWIFALIRRTLLFLSFVSICELSFSQGLKVKEFKQSLSDGSAYHAPMDADGHPCGLIKDNMSDTGILSSCEEEQESVLCTVWRKG